MTSWKRTIRFRLSMGFIAIVVIANATVSLVTVLSINHVLMQEVQTRVRLSLNSAKEAYDNHIKRLADFLHAVSLDRSLVAALERGDRAEVGTILKTAYREGGMEILLAVGPDGRVIQRARNPAEHGDDATASPVVRRALATARPAGSTVIVPFSALVREGADLARRAHFEVVTTPAASPTPTKRIVDGMAAAVAVPVLGAGGRLLGLLYGADLLNRRYEIVDRIRDQVFQSQRLDGKEVGTATIFQGDLRISTNVRTLSGARAVGTRLSSTVAEEVLGHGHLWADRAFVVNDWYITAYEPIRDLDGKTVGALYVGLLEAPFVRPQRFIIALFLTMMAITTLGTPILLFLLTKLILRPITGLIEMAKRVIGGDLTARVAMVPPGEMGLLCLTVNQMADAVAERERQLEHATRKQIGQSEKLASIGRLAAGIAHEINNPLTGVLTFAHLLRKKPAMSDEDRQDLDVILRETTRVREIVRGLLDFARESPSQKQPLDINEVIRQTMTLVRSQKEFRKVTLEEHLQDGLPSVTGDRNQLQQVLLNLALNACEAMPQGGTFTLTTRAVDEKILISVADTGCGIKKEHLGRIFDPFFTTKPVGKGTGLGLSVSYGIIQQHSGTIEVDSIEEKGTTFTIALPVTGAEPGPPRGP
jgi:two-component system, NtrC family, sensor kinase